MKTLTEIALVVLLDLVIEIPSKSLSHFHAFTDPTCSLQPRPCLARRSYAKAGV